MRKPPVQPWHYVLRVVLVIFSEKPNAKPAFLDFDPDFFKFFFSGLSPGGQVEKLRFRCFLTWWGGGEGKILKENY